ncbi:Solute carrier family 43 member 3 [Echinococcus granulosus]|uniref:Solute carrier family 43 n=1 Tax=Echinococcus granulosus TaxID=6210 RepID=A0A068WA71_ECHGR|nr:Solute carrier family 43 member 3 [Echinococcus granulosus]CDS15243.1 solute carrier family 43 [Echinococcus granulosus]
MWGICTKLDQCMPFKLRRVLSVIFGVTEMIFFGGIFYGMNALFPVLQKEDIFANLCPSSTNHSGCDKQINMYANALTTYSVVMMVMLIVIGTLIDYIGLRLVKLASTLLYFVGMLMFGFVTPSTSPLIFVGGTLAAVGGMGMMVCTFSVNQLFTKTAVVVLAFVTGSYDASSALFAIVNLTYSAGIPLRITFLILACCGLAMSTFSSCFIYSYWLSDMGKYKNKVNTLDVLEEEDSKSSGEQELEKKDSYELAAEGKEKESELPLDAAADAVLSELFQTRLKSLRSLPFFVCTMYFALALLRFTFFLGELTPAANAHFQDSSTTDRIANTLSFSLAGGILAGLLCGTVIDKLRAIYRPKISHILSLEASHDRTQALLWIKLRPMAFSMYIMATFSLIVSCLVFVPVEEVYYVNFFFLVLMRGFLFSTFSSSVIAAFPIAQFGTLYGIGGSLAGAFSCLQYALLIPPPMIGNGCALAIAVLLFIPPTIILFKSLVCVRRIH